MRDSYNELGVTLRDDNHKFLLFSTVSQLRRWDMLEIGYEQPPPLTLASGLKGFI